MSKISGNFPERRNLMVPAEHTLDRAASERVHGWSQDSKTNAPFYYGNISVPFHTHASQIKALVDGVRDSRKAEKWLGPIACVDEVDLNDVFVEAPVAERLVAIDPSQVDKTGLLPLAAYWQSGWDSALPYVFVRESVQLRLLFVAEKLREFNPHINLAIFDGWRSTAQQGELYDAFYPEGHITGEPLYVSPPEMDDSKAAPHPSGGTLDVTIAFGNKAIELGSAYDYMHDEANILHFEQDGADPLVRDARRILANALAEVGFVPIDSEWWHFEHGTRRWAAKTGNKAFYGNAELPDDFSDIPQITPVSLSRRFYMELERPAPRPMPGPAL